MSEEITDETEYWDNGMVKVEFRNKDGILEGLATHWYESGKPSQERKTRGTGNSMV